MSYKPGSIVNLSAGIAHICVDGVFSVPLFHYHRCRGKGTWVAVPRAFCFSYYADPKSLNFSSSVFFHVDSQCFCMVPHLKCSCTPGAFAGFCEEGGEYWTATSSFSSSKNLQWCYKQALKNPSLSAGGSPQCRKCCRIDPFVQCEDSLL